MPIIIWYGLILTALIGIQRPEPQKYSGTSWFLPILYPYRMTVHSSSNNDTFIRMVRSEPTFILRLCVIWITFWYIFIDVRRQYQIRYIFSIHYFICSLPTPSCRETCSPDCWPDSDFLSDLSHLFAFVGVVAVVTDVVILRRTNEGWVHPLHPGGHDLTLAPPQQIQSPHG